MALEQDARMKDPTMDPAALYREEIFTDRKVGTIRCLHPVMVDGSPDPARKTIYSGEAQMLTAVGTLPLTFDIEADSLREAVDKYAAFATEAVERTMRELQDLRRQASSSIVIPERGAGFGPGGLGGGGKLQIP
jgi:hypothetical protein